MNDSTLGNVKEFQRITANHERLCRSLAKAKKKYQKSFLESDEAKANYKNSDGGQAIVRRKWKQTEISLL